jgi:hypothetical protein
MADSLLAELVAAQADWAAAQLIPSGEASELVESAQARRGRALRAALDGGVAVRVASTATGLTAAEIAERRDRSDA